MTASEPSDAVGFIPQNADAPRLSDHDVAMRFESLGGTGHGCEFGMFQRYFGAEPLSLLRWANIAVDLLITALNNRFEGVGERENTIVFAPDDGAEWWTRDKRYWMAMRSFIGTTYVSREQMTAMACRRLQFLRRKLIEDLEAGQKIFVYRNLFRNLTASELDRLHHAVRTYGNTTLFYIRYADEQHPSEAVEAAGDGLITGYIDHFGHPSDDRPAVASENSFMALCRKALVLIDRDPELNNGTAETLASTRRARSVPASGRRRIALVGNCQILSMKTLYDRFVGARTGDVLQYIPSYEDLKSDSRDAIAQADLIVEQVLDMKPRTGADSMAPDVPRLYFPMVTAAFLWPFAGQPHPKNQPQACLNGTGPYGAETSDSYLNRMILAGVDPEQAVETYANLDVRSRVNLDRMYELVIDRQRVRDEAAGYNIAEVIDRHFRTEQVFLTPYHPNTRVAVALAAQFFRSLGAEPAEIERMQHTVRVTPFPKDELPIHPGVARHFGMDFVTPERRYRFLNEGLFTFREFALRYMRYEWNQTLAEGLDHLHKGRPQDARPVLAMGLEQSPNSAAGHNAMRHILLQAGDRDAALTSARRAVAIEPESAAYRAALGGVLRDLGQHTEAEAELREAIRLEPTQPHHYMLLAHLLRHQGRVAEAMQHLQQAAAYDPYSTTLQNQIAELTKAQPASVSPEGQQATIQSKRARELIRGNRLDDALTAAREAVDLVKDNPEHRTLLSEVLLRKGRVDEATMEALRAVLLPPPSGAAYVSLGKALYQGGDDTAAEDAYRMAIALSPQDAHCQHELSVLLKQQQRLPEAIAAARRATEIQPGNHARFEHLATFLLDNKELPAARVVLQRVLELAPSSLNGLVCLSDLCAREGKLDEALTHVEAAVAHHPQNTRALGHRGHILQLRGDLEAAEASYRRALELEPANETLLRQLGNLQARRERSKAA